MDRYVNIVQTNNVELRPTLEVKVHGPPSSRLRQRHYPCQLDKNKEK